MFIYHNYIKLLKTLQNYFYKRNLLRKNDTDQFVDSFGLIGGSKSSNRTFSSLWRRESLSHLSISADNLSNKLSSKSETTLALFPYVQIFFHNNVE